MKRILVIVLLLVTLFTFSGCQSTTKFVASKDFEKLIFEAPTDTIDDIVYHSTICLRIRITGQGVEKYCEAAADIALEEKTGEDISGYMITQYPIEVLETYYNDTGEEISEICQLGPAEDVWETKVKDGKEYIVFLFKSADGFGTSPREKGIYQINEDGTIYAYSDVKGLCVYDGKDYKKLAEKIVEASATRMK